MLIPPAIPALKVKVKPLIVLLVAEADTVEANVESKVKPTAYPFDDNEEVKVTNWLVDKLPIETVPAL